MPRFVLNDMPDALFGDFSDPVVAAFFNNTVYVGDQDWLSVQYDIITQNNFSLNVVQLPGEDELMDLLTTTYARKQPLLFYFWSPHLLPANIQLIRVQLPNDSKESTFPLPNLATHKFCSRVLSEPDFGQSYLVRPSWVQSWNELPHSCTVH